MTYQIGTTDFRRMLPFPRYREAVDRLLDYHGIARLADDELVEYYNAGYRPDMVSREVREKMGLIEPREVE